MDPAAAQTPSLSLSGGSGAPGATVTLGVSLSSNGGTQPASIQWDFGYSSTDLSPASGTYYATGAATSAAGKSATCNTISAGDIRCVVAGINTTAIGNCVIASVTFQIAAGTTDTSTAVMLTNLSPPMAAAVLSPSPPVARQLLSTSRPQPRYPRT